MSGWKTQVVVHRVGEDRIYDVEYPWSDPPGTPDEIRPTSVTYTNRLLLSEGHKFYKLGHARGDIGGDFWVEKHEYEENGQGTGPFYWYEGAFRARIVGQFAVQSNVTDLSFPIVMPTNTADLLALGSTCIARTRPTAPRVNGAAMVGEILTGGLPSLSSIHSLRSQASVLKKSGSAHLEAQFGWKPFISDLKKLNSTISNTNKLLEDYCNNSGKRIKRRLELPIETSSSTDTTEDYPHPRIGLTRNPYAGAGRLVHVHSELKAQWFTGCFTYYVPPEVKGGLNLDRNEQLSNYLYGTRVTPEVIWQIAPWSWAVDWLGNVDDVLANISSFTDDGLTLEYAYIMEHKMQRDAYTLVQSYSDDPNSGASETLGKTLTLFQAFQTDVKTRTAVGPYNVKIDWTALSPYQLGIAAALGFARHG